MYGNPLITVALSERVVKNIKYPCVLFLGVDLEPTRGPGQSQILSLENRQRQLDYLRRGYFQRADFTCTSTNCCNIKKKIR